jgi:hypothetical protein
MDVGSAPDSAFPERFEHAPAWQSQWGSGPCLHLEGLEEGEARPASNIRTESGQRV